jgi:hypothetical protein
VLVLAGSSVRDVEQRVEHDVFGVIVLDGAILAVDPPAKFQIDSNQTPNSFQSKNDERISLNGFFFCTFYITVLTTVITFSISHLSLSFLSRYLYTPDSAQLFWFLTAAP